MKIGFLLCAYNQEEFISDCLKELVWFSLEGGHVISAVSVPFKEYENMGIEEDSTISILQQELEDGAIDYLFTSPKHISEAEARNLALEPLLADGCDLICLVDSDEIHTKEGLEKIFEYVESSELIDWWSISYKNYVGDGYLEEPFTPPRIFKTKIRKGELKEFYFDNDVIYDVKFGDVNYKTLSNKVIPKEVAWIIHKSWTNTEKNKNKILYQESHFSHGLGCSFKWDDEKGIIFNDEFYRKSGQVKPKVVYEK